MEVIDKQMIESAKLIKKGCKETGCKYCPFKRKDWCCLHEVIGFPRDWYIPPYKPTLTEDEKAILRNVNQEWIARDEDGYVRIFETRPIKGSERWELGGFGSMPLCDIFQDLFQWCKWEDEEPWYIPYLLKEE